MGHSVEGVFYHFIESHRSILVDGASVCLMSDEGIDMCLKPYIMRQAFRTERTVG